MDGSLPEWLAVAFFAYAGVRLYRFMGRMDRIRDLERRLIHDQANQPLPPQQQVYDKAA